MIDDKAVGFIIRKLVPVCLCTTPNFYEAQVLSGMKIENEYDYYGAALSIQSESAVNVLIKGNHSELDEKSQTAEDYLLNAVTWDLNIGSKFGPINHWGINIS